MSWFSNIGDAIGGAFKKVGSFVKPLVTPLASFAVGLIPGVGTFLSKGVDALGNSLLGDASGGGEDLSGAQSPSAAMNMLQQFNGSPFRLGQSEASQALSNANGFFGIGGSSPGIFGIGDGKPGVFGIGTGKHPSAAAAAKDASATPWLIGGAILALLAL